MLLANHSTATTNSVQEERVSYSLFELKSHLEDLTKSLKEVQIDLFYLTKHLNDLEEALNETK